MRTSAMRMEKLTSKFQMALSDAQSLAVGRDHQFIEPVHLMIALLDQDGGTVRHLLSQADVNVNRLRSQLDEALERLPKVEGASGDVHVSNDLNRLLNVTDKLAQQRKDQYISSELFVLAALEDKGVLGDMLRKVGAAKGPIEQAIDKMRGGEKIADPNAEERRQALDKYTIDLTDEAASRIRIDIDSMPELMDKLERGLIQLKIEREALKKEHDEASRIRLDTLQGESAKLEREYSDLEEVWKAEKAALQGNQHIKEELEQVRQELETARRAGDLSRMSELQYGRIPELEKRLAQTSEVSTRELHLLRIKVSEEECAEVGAKGSGIPVSMMLEGERE